MYGVLCLVTSHVQLFVTHHGVHQVPLTMGFSKQEYWSGLACPPGDLPNPGIEPGSPALQVDSLPAELPGKPYTSPFICIKKKILLAIFCNS